MPNTIKPQDLSAYKTAGSTYITDNLTGKPFLFIPYSNSAKFSMKGGKEVATAQSDEAVVFYKSATLDMELEVQLANIDLFAFMSGSTVGESTKKFIKREVFDITSADQEVELSDEPKGGVIQAFTLAKDYENSTHIKELDGVTYDSSGKKATLTGSVIGDKVAVYYYSEKLCRNAIVKATPEESRTYRVDTLASGKSSADDGNESFLNIVAPKCTVENSMDINLDSSKASSFTIKISGAKSADGTLMELRQVPLN